MAKTYIVILAYNEAEGLPQLLEAIRREMDAAGLDFHVLVVNDGSTDRTREVALEAARAMPLDVLDHATNRNCGAAFRTGITEACRRAQPADVVVTIEGDNTNDASVMPAMIRRVADGCDVVAASRYCRGGGIEGFPFARRIYSTALNWMLRLLYPIRGISDYSFFYRAYRAAILQRALAVYGGEFIESTGFVANAEILLKLRPLRLRGGQVPTRYLYHRKASQSKMRIGRTIAEYLRLFRCLRAARRKYFG
ncbi:MAG: glycosyltransferase family 2 protein [Candidatus Sumerlaeia bacterium]|nr:glycosyltransferase family 2 protein [Candidatus Sumerlaeia bacterium]